MIVKGISFSSDRKLSRCEMQYHYRYEEKLNLKRKKIGLFRGDLGHQLVQAHYTRPGPGWRAKFEELKTTRWDNLFDEEKEDYGMDFMGTLSDLMEHYEDHWRDYDKDWSILHVEQEFSINTKYGWPIRWKADLVVQEKLKVSTARRIKGHEQTRNVLVEHKFKKKIPEAEERILQPQVHSYAWLLGKKGIQIDTILWDYIRTEPVPRPKINKDGNLSIRQISTDRRGYLKSLAEAGIEPRNPDEALALQNKLETLPETLALERIRNSVNLKMGENFVRDWVDRALRAEKIDRPLRTWNSDCKFDCDYYLLCQCDMRGDTDRNLVILKSYEPNKGRPEVLK
jgi:PD-(D/E)XK nuclease superfamily protein